MGFIFFIVAVSIATILLPIAIVYSLIRLLLKPNPLKAINSKFGSIAVAIDQLGNSVCAELFNDTFIKSNGYMFGNPDETISSALGKNERLGTLKRPGKILNYILSFIDKDHSLESIEEDENYI